MEFVFAVLGAIAQRSNERGRTVLFTEPTQIRVHGWVMLASVDSDDYRIEPYSWNGIDAYAFYRPRGSKRIVIHRADSVDSWVRADHADLNRIEVLTS